MKSLLALPLLLMLVGCAGLTDVIADRTLYAPAPLNAAKSKSATSPALAAYQAAHAAVQKANSAMLPKADPADAVFALVDAGIAAANSNCRSWFSAVSAAELRFAQGEGNLGVVENAITGVLGAAKASYGLITGYGIAATALEGYNQNFRSSVLGIADYDLQSKITEIMAERAAAMRAAGRTMTYPQALDAIDAYAGLCTPQAARATVKSAMGATSTVATPTGALRSTVKVAP